MPGDAQEPMRRITLTVSFDQGLLEIEGKSEASGRLFNGDFRGAKAANLIAALSSQLADHVRSKESLPLNVDADAREILPDQ